MLPGATLDGRYLLEEEVGAGGMGTVYRALDLTSGSSVAVKVLHPGRAAEAARAAREADTLAALPLPGVVRYLGQGSLPGTRYLVTEWIAGGTLADRLVSSGLTAGEAVQVTRQVAEILAPVHAAGIVHRDIKPSNILLAGGDLQSLRLIDFGLAWGADMTRLTRTGALVGTPGYMAPEQVRGERALDPRIDVFALGCLLYESLTGRSAFLGDGITAVQAKILLAQPPSIAEVLPDAPAALAAIVDRLLAKDPRRRPADGGEVAALLAALPALPGGRRRPRPPGLWDQERQRLERAASEPTVPQGELFWLVLALADDPAVIDARVAATAAAHGAGLEALADGSVIAVPAARGSPGEQAERAARLALALRAQLPDAPIVVVSAAGDPDRSRLVEGAIERGARALEAAALAALAGEIEVRVDERTAGLLGPAFQVERSRGGFTLRFPAPP